MKSIYNIYNLLSLYKKIKSTKIKALGLITTSLLGFRHLSLRIDPALTCNLACRMCYFSNSEKREQLHGKFHKNEMTQIARIFFPKAFQLVLGCGAEPTMNRDFIYFFELAKQYNIPNISIVTNGLFLTEQQIREMAKLGVSEIILSAHGLTQETYESFMVRGRFKQFIHLLKVIDNVKTELKSDNPKVRINFTVNTENLNDLEEFQSFSNTYKFQTFQVRPIMDIGGEYSKLFVEEDKNQYNTYIEKIKVECKQKGIALLANTTDINYNKKNKDGFIIESVYTYISPNTFSQLNVDINKISLMGYKRKISWYKHLFRGIFFEKKTHIFTDNMLKYDIS